MLAIPHGILIVDTSACFRRQDLYAVRERHHLPGTVGKRLAVRATDITAMKPPRRIHARDDPACSVQREKNRPLNIPLLRMLKQNGRHHSGKSQYYSFHSIKGKKSRGRRRMTSRAVSYCAILAYVVILYCDYTATQNNATASELCQLPELSL